MSTSDGNSLPDYIVVDPFNLKAYEDSILRKVAEPFEFPLSDRDKDDINTLVGKYDTQEEVGGLAAPQIGISKRAIIFGIPYLFQNVKPFPRSVWINPSWVKVNDEMEEQYEACYSVKEMAGPVKRYKTIAYVAYTTEGKQLKGRAEGIAARIIQHEVDHLDGKLFVDYVPQSALMPVEEAHKTINIEEHRQFDHVQKII